METQSEAQKALQNAESLNRTMQYGNFFFKGERRKKRKSLNRTMQYGNFFEAL